MKINWGVLIPIITIIIGAYLVGGLRVSGIVAIAFGVVMFIANMIPTRHK